MTDIENRVVDEVEKVVKGKRDIIIKVYAAILAGGHILLEDIPGVGKTTLATAFARTLDMKYNRVQFTPDVLPSDIMGFSMYNAKSGEFEYRDNLLGFHPGCLLYTRICSTSFTMPLESFRVE